MAMKPEKIAELRKNWEQFSDETKKMPGYAEAAEKFDREYEVAVALNKARTKAKLSQKELAERLHTTQSVISRMESGRANISLAKLQSYAEACGGRLEIKIAF
jgi:Predicted transcriptional regulator with C-terminal CBS domains